MTTSLRSISFRLAIGSLALFGVMACSQADSATTSELERDLEATKMAEMEMANGGGQRTDIVSSVERIPTGEKKPVTTAPAPKASPDSTFITVPEIEGMPAPRPRAPEPPKPTRKGPYKSTSEVIRNAPFPINP